MTQAELDRTIVEAVQALSKDTATQEVHASLQAYLKDVYPDHSVRTEVVEHKADSLRLLVQHRGSAWMLQVALSF